MHGSGGGGSAAAAAAAASTVVEEQERSNNNMEVSSYPDELGLELDLGLGLGSGPKVGVGPVPRILTAKDLEGSRVSSAGSSCSSCVCAGSKRSADSVTSPSGVSQVVGWPPVRVYRMNTMANHAKTAASGINNSNAEDGQDKRINYAANDETNANPKEQGQRKSSLFVKVNMDGIGIGRKVDLNAHSGYESLAHTLEEMFARPSRTVDTLKSGVKEISVMARATTGSKLPDGSSDFVLTYEDKDGDWMLVGDVPWGMFLSSVKRLRIMRTSEANGLAPRTEDRSGKQRCRPM